MKKNFSKNLLKTLLVLNTTFGMFNFEKIKAEYKKNTFSEESSLNEIQSSYLDAREELNDYILDSGDVIYIEFKPAEELNSFHSINEEGEIILPRLNETFVKGLTPSELEKLLEKKYLDYLISPEIKVRLAKYKPIRILVTGEVVEPGIYTFPGYISSEFNNEFNQDQKSLPFIEDNNPEDLNLIYSEPDMRFIPKSISGESNSLKANIKSNNENVVKISNVIKEAGGITSKSDLSKIQVIRDIPISKGGGKKKAEIDLMPFINKLDSQNNIRLFDGDRIVIPKISKSNPEIIPKSILSGISPRFIEVQIFGRVDNPGKIKLPLEATLSDAIDLTGPVKPLSGKIILIRYNNDGSVLKKDIKYSSKAPKGSKRNPYVKAGDLISVKNSFFGKSAGIIREVTSPFVGIYTTKKLIDDF